jgi:hypothetical protein
MQITRITQITNQISSDYQKHKKYLCNSYNLCSNLNLDSHPLFLFSVATFAFVFLP